MSIFFANACYLGPSGALCLLFSSHCSFDLLQGRKHLLVKVPTSNDLQTHGSILVHLWRIQFIAETILLVLGHITCILWIFLWINGRDWKDSARVVQQIPLRGVAPISGLVMRRCGTKRGRTENDIDLLTVICGSVGPGFGIE